MADERECPWCGTTDPKNHGSVTCVAEESPTGEHEQWWRELITWLKEPRHPNETMKAFMHKMAEIEQSKPEEGDDAR